VLLRYHANVRQCWIFFEVIFVTVFYVETRGPTLEEVAKIFDGDDAEVADVEASKMAAATTSGFEKDENIRIEQVRSTQ
jgi:hypothetical protein